MVFPTKAKSTLTPGFNNLGSEDAGGQREHGKTNTEVRNR